ncbi:hypothetical protein ACGF5F_32395 [Streptomyces sp. NPDC047821]|uniref:hypothetical protein n=1 Tax=Streptomyces sp. NPDC047821 TaxID=3365488 RepID=UPI0037174BC2
MSASSQTTPITMTVRVCDRGTGRGYVGVAIRTVTIAATCPQCGGPRGTDTVRNHNFHEDGEWLSVDRWTNPCGHVDMYSAVLREARLKADAERDAADIRELVEGGDES